MDINNNSMDVDFWCNLSKSTNKLSLTNLNIDQDALNSLSIYLQTEECSITDLIFDGINLSDLDYVCCVTLKTKINKLWLRCCQLKDKGINNLLDVLDETDKKTQLILLYLDSNGITCEGVTQIAQVLRTNRTLQSLSLANNLIKDRGAVILVSVLSSFRLTNSETTWIKIRERRRVRIIEFLIDAISTELRKKQGIILSANNSDSGFTKSYSAESSKKLQAIVVKNLKQKAESMIVPFSHAYLTGPLLESGSGLYCPGNFKISYLNISYNRFSPSVLNIIERSLQYQHKICLTEEGLKILRLEDFDTRHMEYISKLESRKISFQNKTTKGTKVDQTTKSAKVQNTKNEKKR